MRMIKLEGLLPSTGQLQILQKGLRLAGNHSRSTAGIGARQILLSHPAFSRMAFGFATILADYQACWC